MRKLSEDLTKTLVAYFFQDGASVMSEAIGRELLEEGSCVVAGDECIYRGAIGNFINTKKSKAHIGCLEYKFDLESFLKSEYFKPYKESWIKIGEDTIEKAKLKLEELTSL
tara:strand:+ start:462 stop:794 length:333 start_codon:yes stop_codon:yes gene_type:complete